MNAAAAWVTELETPALVVDLDIFAANLAAAEAMALGAGKRIRPHVKTHRTPDLALRQLGPATGGVTCATVGEAEAMVAAGVSDLLLANEIVTAQKMERMARLASRARVAMAIDAPEVIPTLSAVAVQAGVDIHVLVDLDVGLSRCGVRHPSAAVGLALAAHQSPGLRFAGLMGYEGRLRASDPNRRMKIIRARGMLADIKSRIEAAGLPVETVSAGGTSTMPEMLADPNVTEVQAGTYALMEHDLDGLGLPFRPCAYVVGAVISRSPGSVVVDVGRKTVGCDYGPPVPMLAGGATVAAVSEEHTVLRWPGPTPQLGDRVQLRPGHIRTTFNLHDTAWLARGERIVGPVPVAARGGSH